MKVLLTIALFTIFGALNAQRVICGNVYSHTHPVLPVQYAMVLLESQSKDLQLISVTDSSGYYYFSIPDSYSIVEMDVIIDAKTNNGRVKDGRLKFDGDPVQIDLTGEKKYQKDFYLQPGIEDVSLPAMIFAFNSTKLSLDTTSLSWQHKTLEDAILCYRKILTDNPEAVIQIDAYCSSTETNPKKLSQKRANVLRNELLVPEITRNRIVAIGKGIDSTKYSQDNEWRNRQAYIRVIRFDFKHKK